MRTFADGEVELAILIEIGSHNAVRLGNLQRRIGRIHKIDGGFWRSYLEVDNIGRATARRRIHDRYCRCPRRSNFRRRDHRGQMLAVDKCCRQGRAIEINSRAGDEPPFRLRWGEP